MRISPRLHGLLNAFTNTKRKEKGMTLCGRSILGHLHQFCPCAMSDI